MNFLCQLGKLAGNHGLQETDSTGRTIGDNVVVRFEQRDSEYLVMVGCFFSQWNAEPFVIGSEFIHLRNSQRKRRLIKTRTGKPRWASLERIVGKFQTSRLTLRQSATGEYLVKRQAVDGARRVSGNARAGVKVKPATRVLMPGRKTRLRPGGRKSC